MEKHSITLGSAEILFAKLSATPSPTSWSHVYSAGTLFAVISLKYTEITQDVTSLSMVGKDMISTLEEEYFTLEAKSFEGVKEAVLKSIATVPAHVYTSIALAAIPPGKDNLLYIYTQGNGSVIFRRNTKTGYLLRQQEEFQSASGLLEDKDTVVLATNQITTTIPSATIISSLDLSPSDFAEFFMPKVLEGDGGEAAFILSYNKKQSPPVEEVAPPIPDTPPFPVHSYEENEELAPLEIEKGKSFNLAQMFSMQKIQTALSPVFERFPKINTHLTHTKKLVLTITVIVIIALVSSVILIVKKQQDAKNQAEVQQILEAADKRYNEGLVLVVLNKGLARDDFEQSKQLLEDGKKKFSKGSTEYQQLEDLLAKVTTALEGSSDTTNATATEVGINTSPRLSLIANKKAIFATLNESTVYYISSSGISSVGTNGTNEKQLIKKVWDNAKGIGVFGSNIYVVDSTSNQIMKFVPSGSVYSKSNYLPNPGNFSTATDMAIDGSIYILSTNGSVVKFTKGKADTFNLSGLEKPLSNPSRLFTNEDTPSLYVLDAGNRRIVVLSKNGAYQSQIQADILSSASDFDVNTKDKKIFVLSKGKLYELPLP